jgi:hypothetical protein
MLKNCRGDEYHSIVNDDPRYLNLPMTYSPKDAFVDRPRDSVGGHIQSGSKPRILVVDDIADNRIILTAVEWRVSHHCGHSSWDAQLPDFDE